jgi:hypothetical protein
MSSDDPLAMPLAPKGLKIDGWIEFYGMLTGTHHYGYDPVKDFREYSVFIS